MSDLADLVFRQFCSRTLLAPRLPTVSDRIRCVIEQRAPSQVFNSVVDAVIIPMQTEHSLGTKTRECLKNEDMNAASVHLRVSAKVDNFIALRDRRRQPSPAIAQYRVAPSPLEYPFEATPNAPVATSLVAGEPDDVFVPDECPGPIKPVDHQRIAGFQVACGILGMDVARRGARLVRRHAIALQRHRVFRSVGWFQPSDAPLFYHELFARSMVARITFCLSTR
jgi:hypothetical protein